MTEENGTLAVGEFHPAARLAMEWINRNFLLDFDRLFAIRESLASCAIAGNRMADVCSETLRRLIEGEPISDRYLLGLAWFIRSMEDENF